MLHSFQKAICLLETLTALPDYGCNTSLEVHNCKCTPTFRFKSFFNIFRDLWQLFLTSNPVR